MPRWVQAIYRTGRSVSRSERGALVPQLPLLMAGALLTILIIFGFVMYDARLTVARDVGTSAANLASAVAHHVDRDIELLDLSLQNAAEVWGKPAVQALDPALRNLVLFDGSTTASGIGVVLVLDATGRVRASSRPLDSANVSLADREYFKVHDEKADVGLFVSKPFVSRISHEWQIGLSRRINNPDGSFGGVVIGTLHLAYLHSLYGNLDLGSGGSITLFRADGIVLTREPYAQSDIGRDLGTNKAFGAISTADRGSAEAPSPIDGKSRIISFHRVGHLPLIQDIEISTDQAYADWWRKTLVIGSALAFVCATSLSLLLMLRQELVRRVAMEAALAHLAATDALTGLPNRRRFDEALDQAWRHALRHGTILTLLMIDADHFKAYNDIHGHPAGDALLKAFAQCIRSAMLRPTDLAARYGGEEFAVLLPDTDAQGGRAVAEAIRGAIADLEHPHRLAASGIATISIGISSIRPSADQTSALLLSAADAALYRAKAEGRNCVRLGPPPIEGSLAA